MIAWTMQPDPPCHLRARKAGETIVIQVKDEGIGIPKAQQSSIFEAFEQVDDSSTRHFGGSGLGLAITQQMVALLEGQIEHESTPGEGTLR